MVVDIASPKNITENTKVNNGYVAISADVIPTSPVLIPERYEKYAIVAAVVAIAVQPTPSQEIDESHFVALKNRILQ